MTCVVGSFGGLCCGAVTTPTTIDGTAIPLEIQRETLGKRERMLHVSGAIGSRFRALTNVIDDIYTVGGTIELNPSPRDLETLWYYILGGDKDGLTFDTTETLPEFSVMVDRVAEGGSSTGTWLYEGLKVRRAVFNGRANDVIRLTLEVVGKTETFESSAYPSLTFGTTEDHIPYVFHDVALSYNSVAWTFESFEMVIENTLDVVYGSSTSATELFEVDSRVFLNLDSHWQDSHTATYDISEVTGTMTWSHFNSDLDTTITFGKLVQLANPPTVAGRGFLSWPLTLESIYDGTTPAISVDHDPDISPAGLTADDLSVSEADSLTIGQANELLIV